MMNLQSRQRWITSKPGWSVVIATAESCLTTSELQVRSVNLTMVSGGAVTTDGAGHMAL